jgi:hypothetical protein
MAAATALVTPVLTAAPAGAVTPGCGTSGSPTVTALQDPHFYVDTSSTPAFDSHYAGYHVVNGSSGYQNFWVKLDSFQAAGGGASVIGLSPAQNAGVQVGQLAASATSDSYFLLKATGTTTTGQSHAVTLWSGDPSSAGSTAVCTQSFTYATVENTIQANANKISSTTTSGSSGSIGSTLTVAINGETGTVGAGPSGDPGIFDMSGAAVSSFPASAWQLVGTSLTMSPDGTAAARTWTNLLKLANASGGARTYAASYTFRAVGTSASTTTIYPMQYIASGTNVKHTVPPTGATLPSIPAASNNLTLSASVSPTMLPSIGGNGTYSVVVANAGSSAATINDLTFTLPSGVSYRTVTSTAGGSATANPTITGSTLLYPGPWTIPASGTLTFTLGAAFPASAGTYTASAVAHVGSVQIDTTLSTADNAPATPSLVVNVPPSATNDSGSVYSGASTTVTVLTNDTVAAPYTKSVNSVGSPAHGTATLNANGTITYASTGGYAGTDSFTYNLSDGFSTSTATVTITVYAKANAAADSATTYAGTAVTVAVLSNDTVDPAYAKSVSAVGSAANGTASLNADGTITYTPNAGFTGTDSYTYTLSDGHGSTATATVTVTVYAKAAANGDATSTYAGDAVTTNVIGNDTVDAGYTKAVSAVGSAANGTALNNGNGTITYTPNAGFTGTDSYTYTLSDGHGSTATATVTVTVYAKPTAGDDSGTTDLNTAATLAVLGNDSVDPAFTKTVSAVGSAANGTVVNNGDGTITYTPNAGFSGTDSFTYTVADGHGLTATATVTITVRPAAPVATADSGTTPYGTDLVVAAPGVLGNDSGSGLTTSVATTPTSGTVTMGTDGSFTYHPANGFVGTDSFTYTATDSFSRTATATVTITVSMPAAPGSCGAGWQYNGTAAHYGTCQILLTPATAKVAGTAFWPGAQPSSKIATIAFDTWMGTGTGADGIGLVFADPAAGATATSLGGTGGQLGIGGIPANVVTLDTFKNTGDPSANFAGLCTSALTTGPIPGLRCTNAVNVTAGLRGTTLVKHHVVVKTALLSGKTVLRTVTIDGVNVITTGLMQLPPSVLIGFSSATGTSTDIHIVGNVAVTYRP